MRSFIVFLPFTISVACANSIYIARRSNLKRNVRNDVAKMKAIAILRGDTVNGIIYFQQDNKNLPTRISGEISGLTPGLHGFHIHEYGDTRNSCRCAGGHFNPFGKTHGGPTDRIRHIGDLGNIKTGSDGIAYVNIISNYIKLSGPISIVGRALVVHANEDDFGKGVGDQKEESLRTGNAGGRIACAIIGITPAT
ncbi:unnamed protein product [Litomosoides sigmodontis]|uniref:Superoxide dismutase [Cu-Zn] n=1 Tax=Litomosoides sigmodontis TaxID=42156 RepID=A0A3P6T6W3_LITSI|nr:unnamed protein product [Litomosoides sigmodontis]